MIILSDTIYNIKIINTTNLVVVALCLLVPLFWFAVLFIANKFVKKEDWIDKTFIISFITFFMILIFIAGMIMGVVLLVWYIESPNSEIMLYNAMVEERVIIQHAVDEHTEMLPDHVYSQLINFNRQLAMNEEYVTNPYYAPMRWKMDWNSIPRIEIPKQITVAEG